MFFATPDDPENRFGTLLALYMVAKAPDRGILVKVAGRVDVRPGHRPAGRPPSTTCPSCPTRTSTSTSAKASAARWRRPSACGTYATEVDTSPWLDPSPSPRLLALHAQRRASAAAPARSGTLAPFAPGATGGTLNAQRLLPTRPFYLHLTRTDAEQEITSYSAPCRRACSARSPASPSARRRRSRPPSARPGAESAQPRPARRPA